VTSETPSEAPAEKPCLDVDGELALGLRAEYAALRDECLKRLGMRHQTVNWTLIAGAGFLTLGLAKGVTGLVVLVFPILALFLAVLWAQNDVRIGELGDYIRTKIERRHPGLGWEEHLPRLYYNQHEHLRERFGPLRLAHVYAAGIFLTLQLLAWAIGLVWVLLGLPSEPLRWERNTAIVLLVLDVLAMALTFSVVTRRRRNASVGGWDDRMGQGRSEPIA
jgi:hypothetical protein